MITLVETWNEIQAATIINALESIAAVHKAMKKNKLIGRDMVMNYRDAIFTLIYDSEARGVLSMLQKEKEKVFNFILSDDYVNIKQLKYDLKSRTVKATYKA